jgi:SAM-dependent methyltransferase
MEFLGFSIPRAVRRLLRDPNRRYDSLGYCPSCGRISIFADDLAIRKWLIGVTDQWETSDFLKETLRERENFFCVLCSANFRMRAHAAAVLRLVGMRDTRALIARLKRDETFVFYETAAYSIFRFRGIRALGNYRVSEFFDDLPPGALRGDIRNENLECLTFPDDTFDVVVNSDVLEHVADLDKALTEVKRVLKPGGVHVFTVPADAEQKHTVERAKVVGGRIEHFRKPVMHGDTVREGGVLVFRDFGRDILEYMSRDGFVCEELRYSRRQRYLTSVYYARKSG